MKAVVLKPISLCCCSVTKWWPTLYNPMDCSMPASLSFTVSQSLLRLMSTESVMPSKLFIFYCPLILFSIFPNIRVFSKESTGKGGQSIGACIRWPKYLELQLQHQRISREYSGLISCRIDWLVWSPCCRRDSQESSPAPQFRSSNSSALSFLYCPTLTSIRDYWKNHSCD